MRRCRVAHRRPHAVAVPGGARRPPRRLSGPGCGGTVRRRECSAVPGFQTAPGSCVRAGAAGHSRAALMVADAEVVRERSSRIRRYVADLRQMAAISESDFLTNRERQYAVLHALQLAIEASVEIA